MHAPKTPLIKIKKIDNLCFEVQSSNSIKSYQVDLNTITYDCSDFPCIHLCKHIVAVVHFFGGVDLGPQPPVNSVTSNSPVQQDGSANSTDDSATASVVSMANEIICLSHKLILKAPHDSGITRLLKSIQSWLSALVLSAMAAGDGSHLPEKENISPNQYSWPETTMQMGVRHGNTGKSHGKGKVDSALTAEHIGEPNHKHPANNNLYGAKEQSGKHAKPNARSAAANARAHAAAERAVPRAEPPPMLPPPILLPPPVSLPLPAPLPASHSPHIYNPYFFHPPLSQPVYSQYSHSQGSAPYHPTYPFSTYSQSHVA